MITTILDGFKQLAPEGCEVAYSRGANIIDLVDDPEGEFYPDGQPRPKLAVSAKFDQQLLDEAVENARRSDLVVAVVGDVVQLVGETCSTATLELLGGQNAMLETLADVARETGKPLVVVLMSSKPQVMPACVIGTNGVIVDESTADGVSAFMWAPNPGMKGGQAIAEIILGETEPSGRLPITFRVMRASCRSITTRSVASTAIVMPISRRIRRSRSARASATRPSNTANRQSRTFRLPARSPPPIPCMPRLRSPTPASARAPK